MSQDQKQYFPNILLINGIPFSSNSATGHLARNILSSWNIDRVSQICLSCREQAPETIDTLYPRNLLASVRSLTPRRLTNTTAKGNERTLSVPRSNLIVNIKSLLGGIIELKAIQIDREMEQWINRVKPDIIYTWLGSPAIHKLVINIARRWKLPIVVHLMDDWVQVKHKGKWLESLSRYSLVHSFNAALNAAAERIAISDAMAAAYYKRYNKTFEVISNCIDLSCFSRSNHRPRVNSSLVLGHCGRVDRGRAKSLLDVEAALRILSEKGIEAQLEFMGVSKSELPAGLAMSPFVVANSDSSDDGIRNLASRVDAFLHVESFKVEENAWFTLSLSAKVPLYLALGRPIVAYGPRGLGTIDYIASSGCGIVVGVRNVMELALALSRAALEPGLIEELGIKARSLAEARHDRMKESCRFLEIVTRAI